MKKLSATTRLTIAAMSTAISVVCMYAASVLPTGRIALCFIASLCMWIPLNERGGLPYALLTYIATMAITFLLIPNKMYFAVYAAFFGSYGLIKLGIDVLIRDKTIAFILKLIACNIIVGAAVLVASLIFEIDVFVLLPELNTYLMIGIAEVCFIAYELIYSLCVSVFDDKIRRFIAPKR